MYESFSYSGKVKKVQGYGAFITYCYSEGLLHISKITNSYSNELDKKEKSEIENRLKEVFTKEREVYVIIAKIDGKRYSLILDQEDQNNSNIFKELVEHGLR